MRVIKTVKQLLHFAEQELGDSTSSRLDAEVLLSHILGKDRAWLYTWPDNILQDSNANDFLGLIARRKKGVPVAYLTGHREFWSMDFLVNESVLIPRPETELLVETILGLGLPEKSSIADMGCGSGVIGIALAKEMRGWQIVGVDKSIDAIEVSRINRQRFSLKNLRLVQGDWFRGLEGELFDLIVSNPPYIEPCDPNLQQGDVRFEPEQALVSGEGGLKDIMKIVDEAKQFIKPEGYVLIEHGFNQAERVRRGFSENGYVHIRSVRDFAGIERVTMAQRS